MGLRVWGSGGQGSRGGGVVGVFGVRGGGIFRVGRGVKVGRVAGEDLYARKTTGNILKSMITCNKKRKYSKSQ